MFGGQLGLALRYADLLATTGISHGLVGPREAARLWERHLVNCAVSAALVPEGSEVVDIGSGAGLPGLVLAILRPDLRLHLVEPLLRRTTWLESTIAELGLENVSVHRGRAEEMEMSVPVVTARAVASLDKLVRWSFPLLEPQGRLLALKGEAARRELEEVEPLLRRWGVPASTVHVVGEGLVSEPVRVVEIVRPDHLPPGTDHTGPSRPGRRRGGRASRGRDARRTEG
ncbi:16S rRNA (guanine(527)-N(7))-methyltransferase RsmG [Ornithinimicrobium avium]|uniref:Ribosomal RNA small subunit methyltransferase G n=1 Tax=Ornithinimicrobium avium TaxID=2283195 RepID=A0A345NST2_9MICO|nr:16S rRNA (guanine(527)-N(7))-methyltransferase RsmG [Ornithinimicrobium avium]